EYWYLQRQDFEGGNGHTGISQDLLHMLKEGPLPLPEILQRLGLLHRSQLNPQRLFNQEIVAKAGLTPTDLLHVEGRYQPWDLEAADWALEIVSRYLHKAPADVISEVWRLMRESIVAAIVQFVTKMEDKGRGGAEAGFDGWFFSNSLYGENPWLKSILELQVPIVGIGAPAELLLPPVAQALNTELLLPEHFEVANAVGAVGGSVMVEEEILIYPKLSPAGMEVIGYFVQSGAGRQTFEVLKDARTAARDQGRERVLSAAVRSGAENPQVFIEEEPDGIDSFRLRIRAMGNPRLAG
ncbi:MAG: hypothetical protein ACLFWD_02560, partial [Anaerolineales bacterium]